ncbi:hypothetical protein ACSBR1_015324 [Camellia fascicularis]
MEGNSDVAAFKIMNQDFVHLDGFNGTNYARWQDKMLFFLTQQKIAYVLSSDLQPLPPPSDKDIDEINAQRKKREEDEVVCRGHIEHIVRLSLRSIYANQVTERDMAGP